MSENKIIYHNFPIGLCNEYWMNGVKIFCDSIMYYDIYSKWVESYGTEEVKDFDEYHKYAGSQCGIDLTNAPRAYKEGINLYRKYCSKKSPFAGIENHMLFDFYKNDKTEFEIVCLMAFLALRSIIGHKKYARTNFDLMFARMLGFASSNDVEMSDCLDSYKSRYKRTKIIDSLRKDWHLSYYSTNDGVRGFYVSFELKYKDLCLIAESKRKSSVIKAMKEDEKKAKERVMRELKENASLLFKNESVQQKIHEFKTKVCQQYFGTYDLETINAFIDKWALPAGNNQLLYETKPNFNIDEEMRKIQLKKEVAP